MQSLITDICKTTMYESCVSLTTPHTKNTKERKKEKHTYIRLDGKGYMVRCRLMFNPDIRPLSG